MIAQYTGRNQRRWDEADPAIQFALNTAMQESTGYTPAYLNYGRELRTPYDNQRPGAAPPPPEVNRKNLQEVFELVRVNLAWAYQKQERFYNLRRRPWRPRTGEQVWKREHTLSNKARAVNAKLSPRYSGPYTICQIISPVIVDLRNRRGRIIPDIHSQDLKMVNNQAP
ncbi:PREDICTED: uncharacterized protein LOC106750992 [Dinoponera quadriceps]|uniref:Uncharacterized protein LOC106750992 n=1 Tax=Dinoponera quadriceps TaxID=609295 RepID=A0A6P3YB56_DINQU|nr:PREDICTED: uncharacterized protein LOC106750992 [Dinoponera quadriceps]